MSDDETADEEEEFTTEGGASIVEGSRQNSIVNRVAWRSREFEEALIALDRRHATTIGRNARRRRTIWRPPTAPAPTNIDNIPSTAYRWMVAERIRDQFPAVENVVQQNPVLTAAQNQDNMINIPNDWGSDPAFRLVGVNDGAHEEGDEGYDNVGEEAQRGGQQSLDPRLQRE